MPLSACFKTRKERGKKFLQPPYSPQYLHCCSHLRFITPSIIDSSNHQHQTTRPRSGAQNFPWKISEPEERQDASYNICGTNNGLLWPRAFSIWTSASLPGTFIQSDDCNRQLNVLTGRLSEKCDESVRQRFSRGPLCVPQREMPRSGLRTHPHAGTKAGIRMRELFRTKRWRVVRPSHDCHWRWRVFHQYVRVQKLRAVRPRPKQFGQHRSELQTGSIP